MKKLLPMLFSCYLLVCYASISAQTSILSSTPPHFSTRGLNGGLTFLLSTTEHIQLEKLQVALGSTGIGLPLDIYYRHGGVKAAGATFPTIDAAHGWIHWGTTSLNSNVRYATSPSLTGDIDLFLPPGDYGFFVISPATTIAYAVWGTSGPGITSFTDGTVTLDMDTNTCYGGRIPSLVFNQRLMIGGVHYYSYTPAPNDITAYAVDSPAYQCAGSNNVVARLRNYGTNQINSVTVNWSVDGNTQTPVNFTGLIDTIGGTGGYEVQVPLGTANFTTGSKSDIIVWTSLPNGVTDPNASNDSAFLSVTPAMSGIYTIDSNGTGSTNFTSFQDAVTALKDLGVCGPVVMNVKEGIYNERVVIPTIPSTSATNTVTFIPDPGNSNPVEVRDTAHFDPDNYIFKLDGCSYVTIDGITTAPQGSTHSTSYLFENDAHHNTIRNCKLIAQTGFSASIDYAGIYSRGCAGCDANTIEDNHIYGGSYGIYFRGLDRITGLISGITISNNLIEDVYRYGMFIQEIHQVKVENNEIISNSPYTGSSYAIYIRYGNNHEVIGNVVKSPSIFPRFGLYMRSSDGSPTNRGLIANNMIHAGDPTNGSSSVSGMYIQDCDDLDIFNNTVVVEGTSASSRAIYFRTDTNSTAMNNNFLHYGAGYAANYLSGVIDMNYNNLASAGSNLASYLGSPIIDLSAWQGTASKGANSISEDSIYSNLDSLRVCSNLIDGKGTSLPNITMDIDEETRASNPDIGADEFSLNPTNISIGDTIEFCAGDEVELMELNGDIKYGIYAWSTGDTTPTATVTDAGIYSLTWTSCVSATDSVEVIDISPSIDFAINSTIDEYDVDFVNNSTNGTSYSWDFGDGNSSTEKEPTHTYDKAGTYDVTLTVMNVCDTLTMDLTFELIITGITTSNLDRNFTIYPNPADNYVNLEFGNISNQSIQLQLIDMKGRVIHENVVFAGNRKVEKLDVSSLNKGMYLLKAISSKEVSIKQLIIQ